MLIIFSANLIWNIMFIYRVCEIEIFILEGKNLPVFLFNLKVNSI